MSMLRRGHSAASHQAGDPDERALRGLEELGARLGADHALHHYLLCTTRESGATATMQLREAGFEASMSENPTADGWIVVAERFEPLDHESIQLTRSLLELIASRAPGAVYDGWQTELLADEVGASEAPSRTTGF